MAAGHTQVADVVVPEIFTPYARQVTEEKTRIIQAGVAVRDAEFDGMLAGGGNTFDVPSFRDLDNVLGARVHRRRWTGLRQFLHGGTGRRRRFRPARRSRFV